MHNDKKKALGIKPEGTPYRVLVIDDSAFIVKQLSKILTSEDFEIADIAADGLQGYEKFKALHGTIDLVTLDITMPNQDGVSTLEKIFEVDKNANVIMISALGMEDVIKRCLLMGAKNYIKKPFDRDKVLERVVSVLKKN
jgi:two-component system chemotaxis response regulator CheY